MRVPRPRRGTDHVRHLRRLPLSRRRGGPDPGRTSAGDPGPPRNRLGIKQLYYHDDGRRLAFASELKALMLDPTVPREPDPKAVADYLTFQYVPSPGTIWKGVRKLPPGHRLVCDLGGVRVERYWTLPIEPHPRD